MAITNITTSKNQPHIPDGYFTWDETCKCGKRIHTSGDMWASKKPKTLDRTCLSCLRDHVDQQEAV